MSVGVMTVGAMSVGEITVGVMTVGVNLDELPNRILPNLAHLLILCTFTSVLCGVNKGVKENNNNNKKPNPILAFYIQTRGAQTTI
jgi:hypothetical protein